MTLKHAAQNCIFTAEVRFSAKNNFPVKFFIFVQSFLLQQDDDRVNETR